MQRQNRKNPEENVRNGWGGKSNGEMAIVLLSEKSLKPTKNMASHQLARGRRWGIALRGRNRSRKIRKFGSKGRGEADKGKKLDPYTNQGLDVK